MREDVVEDVLYIRQRGSYWDGVHLQDQVRANGEFEANEPALVTITTQ